MASAWDRQDGETSLQYAAFCDYLKLPPSERSILKVATMRGHGDHPATENRWSSQWRWVERASSFDDYKESSAIELVRVGYSEAQAQHLENSSTAYSLALQLGAQILHSMLEEFNKKPTKENPDQGKVDTKAYAQTVRALIAADTGLRRTLGMPTQFKTESVHEEEVGDEVYIINKPKGED